MKDAYNRTIDYMRVSLTDRCNYRCLYCMREAGVDKKAHGDILSLEEVYDVIAAFVSLGGKKIRFTGGEPLVRKNAVDLIERVGRTLPLEQLGLTTNGVYLPEYIERLSAANCKSINISIDSLDADKYRLVTKGGRLEEALLGLRLAREVGATVKVNAVLMRGVNDDSIREAADFAAENGVLLRFIELMPFAENNAYADYGISADEVIARHGLGWVQSVGNADYYAFSDGVRVGFIRPMSHKFCADCNRLRLTSDGKLLPCLHGEGEIDVKPYIADGNISAAIEAAVAAKPPCHHLGDGVLQKRKMNYIGG